MKNLELLNLTTQPIPYGLESGTISEQTLTHVYFFKNDVLYEFRRNHDENERESLTKLMEFSFSDVISLKYIDFESKICVISPRTIQIVTPSRSRAEIKRIDLDFDIETIEWSPSEEIVAIVTTNGIVMTLAIDYQNGDIYSKNESTLDSDIPATVYVGWGSKETQFRGSEGKLTKKNGNDGNIPPVTDQKSRISWRGNGEMFAVNYWTNDRRQFIVYEMPCKALYRSDACPGLQTAIAWRPAGNMIATVTKTTDQAVVIFEKNGQKRFEFDANFGEVNILDMKWSPCATILALLCQNATSQSLRLMTCSNYKWYEKQNLTFDIDDNPLLNFHWLDTTPTTFTLSVVTSWHVLNYKFRSVINRKNDTASICAVVNGNCLQITDFSKEIIPPTLCSDVIKTRFTINAVTFQNGDSNLVAILDCHDNVSFYNYQTNEIIACHDLVADWHDDVKYPLRHYGLSFVDGNQLKVMCNWQQGRGLYRLDISSGLLNFDDDVAQATDPEEVSCAIGTFRLNTRCQLSLNGAIFHENVRSFIVTDRYVIFVTKANDLFCSKLNELDRKSRRTVEQGSIIVTSIPEAARIILQMPRGNLETISIRSIAMDMLDAILTRGEWSKALYFLRLEKLNPNLLYKLNPERFLQQIPNLIEAARTLNELNSIILEIQDDIESQNVKQIYDAILTHLNCQIDYAPYISTVILINLHHYNLKSALEFIQDLLRRTYDDESLKKYLTDAVNTLKSYGHLDYKLYEVALTLYDLELAKFIAGCCQIDPRIWQPQVSHFEQLSELERRYEITIATKNYKTAVKYLLRLPDKTSSDVGDFITKYQVAYEAYQSIGRRSRHFRTVSELFAKHLGSKGRHHEAGAILKRAGALDLALNEFMLALDDVQVLNLLQLKFNDDHDVKKKQILIELANDLHRNRKYRQAAVIYEQHVGNYDLAVKILLEGGEFEQASYLATKHKRNDIQVSDVIPAIEKQFSDLTLKLSEFESNFDKYKSRLCQVRQLKREKALRNDGYDDRHDSDLFSESGSTISTRSTKSSLRSKSSTQSSRNRRKEAKKKQDLRQGGNYEDIALIRALHILISDTYTSMTSDIERCCILTLQETSMSFDDIKQLHDCHVKFLRRIKDGIAEIWPTHFYFNLNQIDSITNDEGRHVDLDNLEHLDLEFRTPPTCPNSDWSLDSFKTPALSNQYSS